MGQGNAGLPGLSTLGVPVGQAVRQSTGPSRNPEETMAGRIPAPDCLGRIPEYYAHGCSTTCHLTALCVLVAMGDYLAQDSQVPPWQRRADSPQEF